MTVSALHHLAVVVRDLERSARFYGDVLGLPEIRRWHDERGLRAIWFSLGEGGDDDPFLAVERGDPEQFRLDTGWHCVALRITRNDRERWEQGLQAAGHPVTRRTDFTLYCRDPDGNWVGLSHYPSG